MVRPALAVQSIPTPSHGYTPGHHRVGHRALVEPYLSHSPYIIINVAGKVRRMDRTILLAFLRPDL
jgi:hypothetical protein